MRMTPVLHPYFSLSGEFDPDEISHLLKMQPSRVMRIGDASSPDALGPRLGAEWSWQPENDDSNDVGDQLAYLAGVLMLKRESVAELSKQFHGTFHVFNQVARTNRTWFLSAQTLRFIADLQVNIECENIRFMQDDEVSSDAN